MANSSLFEGQLYWNTVILKTVILAQAQFGFSFAARTGFIRTSRMISSVKFSGNAMFFLYVFILVSFSELQEKQKNRLSIASVVSFSWLILKIHVCLHSYHHKYCLIVYHNFYGGDDKKRSICLAFSFCVFKQFFIFQSSRTTVIIFFFFPVLFVDKK